MGFGDVRFSDRCPRFVRPDLSTHDKKMKSLLKLILVAALSLSAAAAHASVFKLDFSAANFGPGIFSGTTAPQATVSGSFTISAPTLYAASTTIQSVDLTIAGHRYTLSEVGVGNYSDGYVFGAVVNGIGVTRTNDNDFYLILSSTFNVFAYSVTGIADTWTTRSITGTFTPQAVGGVPEPATWTILMVGVAGLAASRLRRRRA